MLSEVTCLKRQKIKRRTKKTQTFDTHITEWFHPSFTSHLLGLNFSWKTRQKRKIRLSWSHFTLNYTLINVFVTLSLFYNVSFISWFYSFLGAPVNCTGYIRFKIVNCTIKQSGKSPPQSVVKHIWIYCINRKADI